MRLRGSSLEEPHTSSETERAGGGNARATVSRMNNPIWHDGLESARSMYNVRSWRQSVKRSGKKGKGATAVAV